MSRKKEITARS